MRSTASQRDLVSLTEALASLNLNINDFEFGHLIEEEIVCPTCSDSRIHDKIRHFVIKEKPKAASDRSKNIHMSWMCLIRKEHGWELK